MSQDPASVYAQLSQLVREMPNLRALPPFPPETLMWLGRASNLVEELYGSPFNSDVITLTSACNFLGSANQLINAHQIESVVFRALAVAEAKAPAAAQGSFVSVGAAFTALQAVSKVLAEAAVDALIVDPYMNAVVLTDFAPLAKERVRVRLLTDSFTTKPDALRPAFQRWQQQYGPARPLELRFTPPRALHDRVILLDSKTAYVLTQSLKDFAARSPASATRVDPDTAALKIHAYDALWAAAAPI